MAEVLETPSPVWKRPAVARLLLVALLAEVGYAVMNISTMPVYLAAAPIKHGLLPEGRGLGESVIGWIVVAFLLSEAVFKSPAGALADRIGPRKLMLVGPTVTILTSILTVLIPLKWGVWQVPALILLRIGDGVGAALIWPALFSRMGHLVEDAQRQSAMSLLNLCYLLGIALALPIGGFVNNVSGHTYASLLFATCLFAGVSFTVWRFMPNQEPGGNAQPIAEGHAGPGFGEFLRSVREIPTYLLLAAVTFMGIGFPMVVVKLFALDEFKLSELQFGALVFPGAIGMAVLGTPLSNYGERIGRPRAVHRGLLMCAAGLGVITLGAVIPAFHATWALAVGGIPIGCGFLLTIPAWMAAVSDIDPNRRGSNVGAVMTAQGIGAIVGAPIGAALYEKLQPVAGPKIAHYSPFIGCFACIAVGYVLSLKLLPTVAGERRTPEEALPASEFVGEKPYTEATEQRTDDPA